MALHYSLGRFKKKQSPFISVSSVDFFIRIFQHRCVIIDQRHTGRQTGWQTDRQAGIQGRQTQLPTKPNPVDSEIPSFNGSSLSAPYLNNKTVYRTCRTTCWV